MLKSSVRPEYFEPDTARAEQLVDAASREQLVNAPGEQASREAGAPRSGDAASDAPHGHVELVRRASRRAAVSSDVLPIGVTSTWPERRRSSALDGPGAPLPGSVSGSGNAARGTAGRNGPFRADNGAAEQPLGRLACVLLSDSAAGAKPAIATKALFTGRDS